MARRQISEERQAAYYIGTGIIVIGVLLFLSTFVTFMSNFGEIQSHEQFARQGQSEGLRALGGMVLIIIGGIIQGIGRAGLAGSGVILDPEKAREDMEPWNRMTGGMIQDGADEAGIDLGAIGRPDHNDNPDMPFDEKLRRLHQLKLDGILTEEEYERKKRQILDQQDT